MLFSLRSKLLRLQTEMPCAKTDQVREIFGLDCERTGRQRSHQGMKEYSAGYIVCQEQRGTICGIYSIIKNLVLLARPETTGSA